MAANPSLHLALQRVLLADPSTAGIVAGNRGLAIEVQQEIWSMPEQTLHRLLAKNRALDAALQRAMLDHGGFKAALAGNIALLPEQHGRLGGDPDPVVRARLAANPGVAGDLLTALSLDGEMLVRVGASANPNLTKGDQEGVCSDPAESVRATLANNASLEPGLQLRLAVDPDDSVRLALAGNDALTDAACAELVRTEHISIHCRLAGNGAVGERWHPVLANGGLEVRQHLSYQPNLAPDLQRALAAQDPFSLSGLAQNPGLIPELQEWLARIDQPYLHAALLANPSLTRDALRLLLDALVRERDPRDPLRQSLKYVTALGSATYWVPASLDHPILGPMVAARTGKRAIQIAAANHSDVLVRLGLAANLQLKAVAVRVLLADPDADVRVAAAMHAMKALAMFQ